MTGFATARHETSLRWLDTAAELQGRSPEPVVFFAAFEVDSRGIDPFIPVARRLADLNGTWCTYQLAGPAFYRSQVTTANRLTYLCTGRNLIAEYARGLGASHVLYLDADMHPPGDALAKLLEMRHPLVGGHVPTYCLSGPKVTGRHTCGMAHHDPDQRPHDTCSYALYPSEWNVQTHMNTAGFLLAHRSVYSRLVWRWDGNAGMTDDPCYHRDAIELLGVETHVRHDLVGSHWPEALPALEERGHDLRVR